MKTKILSLAATLFAVASISSFAMGGQDMPHRALTSGAANKTAACCAMHGKAKDKACCTTKTVTNAALGGRGATSSTKKVQACKMSCEMPAKAKPASCCKG
jgi:hypothetical protein